MTSIAKHSDYILHGNAPIISIYTQYDLSTSMMVVLHTFYLNPENPTRTKFICYPSHQETILQINALIKRGAVLIPEDFAMSIISRVNWKFLELSDSDSD